MPARLSKLFIDATCKEYAHPWHDSCISASTGLGLHCLQESLRIYATVYIVKLLLRGTLPLKEDIKHTILGILQSTAFLSWSGFAYCMFICSLRRTLGYFNILTVSFIPSFLSSLTAILIERPARRPLLCLYVSNVATETLFKMGVWRGYFSVIPHGETYIFAAGVAVLLYFYRSKRNKNDSIYEAIRFIIGHYEETVYSENNNRKLDDLDHVADNSVQKDSAIREQNYGREYKSKKGMFHVIWKLFDVYKQIIEYLKTRANHIPCPHPYSCAYYTLMGGIKTFTFGACAHVVVKLLFQARRLFQNPKQIKSNVFTLRNLNLAVCLGGFTGIYRFISCLLRRLFCEDSETYAIPAGLIASISFLAYPDNTIALYCMWKALQMLWNDAVEKKKVPEVKWFVIFLYCFSTAVLFHAAIMEPQNLKQTYWKFLCNISGGRVAAMSRTELDKFGLQSSTSLREVLRETNTTDQIKYTF